MALFSGTLLLTMMLATVVRIKNDFHKTTQLLEENLDFAFISDLIQDRIRKAGYTPCLNLNQLETVDTRKYPYSKLQDFEFIAPEKFKINRMDERFWTVTLNNENDRISIPPGQFHAIKNVIVADCYHAEVHAVLTTIKHKENITLIFKKPIFYNYSYPSYIGIWREESFFFDKIKKRLLFSLDKADELSYHVKNMHVKMATHNFKRLINIDLHMSDDKQISVDTVLRMNA